MKVCPHCGTEARMETQKFCASCGRPFEKAESQPTVVESSAVKEEKVPHDEKSCDATEPPKVTLAHELPKSDTKQDIKCRTSERNEDSLKKDDATPMPVRRQHKNEAPAEEVPAPVPVVRRRNAEPSQQAENKEVAVVRARAASQSTIELHKLPVSKEEERVASGQPESADKSNVEPNSEKSAVYPTPVVEMPVAQEPVKQKEPKLAPEAEQSPTYETSEQAVTRKKTASPLKYVVIALVAIIVILAAILAFVLLGKGTDNGKVQSETVSAEVDSQDGTEAVVSDVNSESTESAVSTEQPVEVQPTEIPAAVPSDSQVVIHNAIAEGATITVDGQPIQFSVVGTDAVIARDLLPDVCQVRIIAPAGDNSFQTAAVWFNKDYGNELSFNADYGGYVPCDETGRGKPGDKVVDVLTWAFYKSFLTSINEEDASNLRYSTMANTIRLASEIPAYFDRSYDLGDFSAVSDPATIIYSEGDGSIIYNASFRCIRTFDSGETDTGYNYRTIRLVWEDGVWKVDAFVLIDESIFDARNYAQLP